MSPQHSIGFCPICGGGLCGIRICGLTPATTSGTQHGDSIHGLVVCDECEATWLEPDLSSDHMYPDPVHARCPVCSSSLWSETSRWATEADIAALGWNHVVNRELDVKTDEGIA